MDGFNTNSSLLLDSQRPVNNSSSAGEKTEYESCRHMPAVMLWYMSLQVLNMLLSIPANVLVLWLIHRSKGESSSTSDVFIANLALLDVLFCLTIPLELSYKLLLTSSSPAWNVLLFIYGVKDSSPVFLCCVCLDRYVAVLHPLAFGRLAGDSRGRHYRAVLAAAVWAVTLGYSAARGAEVRAFNSYGVYTGMILAVFAFLVYCNVAILWALQGRGRRGAGGARQGDDARRHPVKKRAFRMVLIVLAIVVLNYFPVVALFPFKGYFSPDVFFCYNIHIAFGLLNFSSTVQPLLYLSKDWLPSRTRRLCCKQGQTDQEGPTNGQTDQQGPTQGRTDQQGPTQGRTDQQGPTQGQTDHQGPIQGQSDREAQNSPASTVIKQ